MKIIKYNLILIMIFILGSCNGFLDVNTDPTRVSDEDITVDVLLPTIIKSTATVHYSQGVYSSQATHQLDGAGSFGYYDRFEMEGAWSTIYLTNLKDINILIDKANAEGSTHYVGVANVLKALNLGLLTDSWENVPYSEALQGANSVIPAYDSQQEIYGEIQSILDNAITQLGATDNFRTIGKEDFIYGGKMDKWIKLAHSLKARYMLHLSNKSGMDWNAVLSQISQGFASNDDDFQLVFNEGNPNPWYSNLAQKFEQAIYIYTAGGFFMDYLNGINFGVMDPRISRIVEKIDTSSTSGWVGRNSWEGDDNSTVYPTKNTFYFALNAPIVMMSYSELKFIEAEANFKLGKADAYQNYLDGIVANTDKLGVDGSSYLADPNIATGSASLHNIMMQKYIALAFNPEVWNDMRRYGYNNDIYKNFVEPDYNDRTVPAYRALYPSSELSRNKDNYFANYKEFTDKMWKDQN